MNRVRAKKVRDLREPEKTALIDIVFLLLIFFFVSLAAFKPALQDQPFARAKSEKVQNIPKIEKPAPLEDRFILLEVIDLRHAQGTILIQVEEFREFCLGISSRLNLGMNFPIIPNAGFMIFVNDDTYRNDIDSLVVRAKDMLTRLNSGGNVLPQDAREVCMYFPAFYPPEGVQTFASDLAQGEDHLSDILISKWSAYSVTEKPQIHLRIPKSTYMRFLKSLYKMLEENGIALEILNIRAVEERT